MLILKEHLGFFMRSPLSQTYLILTYTVTIFDIELFFLIFLCHFRLVKDGKIKSLEEIYLFSLPIKEFEIIDHFLGPALKVIK